MTCPRLICKTRQNCPQSTNPTDDLQQWATLRFMIGWASLFPKKNNAPADNYLNMIDKCIFYWVPLNVKMQQLQYMCKVKGQMLGLVVHLMYIYGKMFPIGEWLKLKLHVNPPRNKNNILCDYSITQVFMFILPSLNISQQLLHNILWLWTLVKSLTTLMAACNVLSANIDFLGAARPIQVALRCVSSLITN